MSEFTTKVTPLKNYDSFKRVAYPFGMLLTPAEFLQEQYYFRERDRLHHRLLHGYGTVCGLNVSVQDNDKISVSEGLALDARGRLIRVEHAQCASLEEWLKKFSDKLSPASPPALLPDSLYVVLCYRECPSDKVLIRTSPCQPKEQSEAYSRVQESFDLKLATEPPVQVEEETIRAFGDLFAELRVSSGSARLSEAELQAAKTKIRALVLDLHPDESPPAVSSPPDGWMQTLHPADAEILFRHAFKVWVTEVKPNLMPDRTCSGSSDEEACVLLAELSINVNPQTLKIEGDVTVNEAKRPFYISTRLLQEYMLNRSQGEALGGVTAHSALSGLTTGDDHPQYLNQSRGDTRYSALGHSHFLDELSDVNVPGASNGDVLTHQGGSWVPAKVSHGMLDDLSNDHHTQYLLADGERPLSKDWNVGNKKITNLKDATQPKDALNLGQANKNFVHAAAGPYQIAAAGRFDFRGNAIGPVYNKLKATPVVNQQGVFTLLFTRYSNPDARGSRHNYIVKGTGEAAEATFHVVKFFNTGIRIRVQGQIGPVPDQGPNFMIEISAIGKF